MRSSTSVLFVLFMNVTLERVLLEVWVVYPRRIRRSTPRRLRNQALTEQGITSHFGFRLRILTPSFRVS